MERAHWIICCSYDSALVGKKIKVNTIMYFDGPLRVDAANAALDSENEERCNGYETGELERTGFQCTPRMMLFFIITQLYCFQPGSDQ